MAPLPHTEEILARLADGESLRAICRTEGFPTEAAVRFRVVEDQPPGFAAQYARARNIGLDAQSEGTIDIADDMSIPSDQKRCMIDARKWFASKMRPDKYGDRIQQQISGPGGEALQPVTLVINRLPDKPE